MNTAAYSKAVFRLTFLIPGLLLVQALSCLGAVVVYIDNEGRLSGVERPEVANPIAALSALAAPPTSEAGRSLTSAVPPGTLVLDFRMDAEVTVIEFSPEILGAGLEEISLTTIFEQVRGTLRQFGVLGAIRMQVAGKLLCDYLAPVQRVAPGPVVQPKIEAAAGVLTGKKIGLSAGHGKFWNGSGWATQRPVYCSPLNQEDYHNLEEMQYLNTYLVQDGATTKNYRCLDKSFGNYSVSGSPWWQMAACYWEKELGYPCSVYASYYGDCTLMTTNHSNDDVRARPLAADYDNTDIYVSLHSNGFKGNCTGSTCPTGSETYYDNSTEHATWGAISQTLATKINTALKNAITANADSTWTCHGTCVKEAAGAYGEIRIPNRAASLTELAYHDTCSRDADTNHLRDNFFRSTAMWGMYKGVCDYFGVVPTWDFYSCEVVTNDIPATMTVGSTATVHISMRNRGVLWNATRLFRLGAVGNSDPFTTTTRYNLATEVGPGTTNTFTIVLKAPATPGTYVTDWQMLRESVKSFGPIVARNIVVVDTQAPTAPANLTGTPVSATQIDLAWQPASDNVGVSNYIIYRDSAAIGLSATTNYTDSACAPSTTYTYQVSAMDGSRNESLKSAGAQATTPAPPPPVLLANFQPGSIVLTWTNGTLQQATNLNPPVFWLDLPAAISPYTPPLDGDASFFRLRNQLP